MPEYINGVPLVWDAAADAGLLGQVLGDGTGSQQLRMLLGNNASSSPLLEQEWSHYGLESLASKFFDASKTVQKGNRLTLHFGGPDPQPGNDDSPFSIRDIILGENHFLRQGELFGYRNKDKSYAYTEGVDEYLAKHLDLYLFFSSDGAWLLEMAGKLNQIGDNELAIFLEISPIGSIDWLSNTVLIAKGGKNAAAYYNQPLLADWYGKHCTITPQQVAELVQSCYDAEALQIFLRNILSDLGSLIAWLPKKAGDLLCWLGEKIEDIAIEKATWDKDWASYWAQFFEEMEKGIANKTKEWVKDGIPLFGVHIPLPESFKLNVIQIGRMLMRVCRAISEFLKEIGPVLNYLFALLCGVINGIVDMVASFFTFIGWILKLIGGAVEEGADALGKIDYYKSLLMEYADNFLQAIQKISWAEVLKSIIDWVKRIYNNIDLGAMSRNISISGRELAYYIGYVGINIVGCFVGLGEIAAITRIGKAEGILKNLMEWVANAVGKLPIAAKLTAEGIFAVLKAYVGLLVKGTKSVIEFINKVFEAILEWVFIACGKVTKAIYLETLALKNAGVYASLLIDQIGVLLLKLISSNVRKNVSKFKLLFKSNGELIHIWYINMLIFEGNKKRASKFLDDVLDKQDTEAQTMLDDFFEKTANRKNSYAKWKDKFDDTFFNHVNGELGVEEIRLGFQKQEFITVGQGGHNPNALGGTIRLKKGTVTAPNPPLDDVPFKAMIEVRYKNEWLPKHSESSMFPENWSAERIREEVAWVYENTVAKGVSPDAVSGNISKFDGLTTNGFKIRVEVKDGKIINAYPNK